MSTQPPVVLIVEDASFDAAALRRMLGGEFETVLGTPEDLQGREDVELVILGGQAQAMVAGLKADPTTAPLPVFLVKSPQAPDSDTAMALGIADFLPLQPAVAKARLKVHLENLRFRRILQRLTWLDALTGIPNREKFLESLESEWRRNARNRTAISLVLLEVDHFDAFCEANGTQAGNEVLRRVIGALPGGIQRAGDVVGRFSDQVFACVLPETDTVGAVSVGERIRAEVNSMAIAHGHSLAAPFVTLSLGVASLAPGRNNLLEDLIEAAEEALARARQRGGNQVMFS